jgi:8-oxo-dGTP pyrophosphatase MutT (NUDIX family)
MSEQGNGGNQKRFTLISAVHVFLRDGDRVLLLRRCNTGYEDGSYSVPAGHMDGNETVRMAAIREVEEECGVIISQDAIRVVGVMHRRASDERIDFFLESFRWDGHLYIREPGKCDDLRWVKMTELPLNTVPYVCQAMNNYLQGIWYSEYGW